MIYPTRTIKDIMNCDPCSYWNTIEKVESRIGEGWEGTIEDVLDLSVFSSAKVWFIIVSGDLSDEKLETFCDLCREDGPLGETEVAIKACRKKRDNTLVSISQEKAIAFHIESCRKAISSRVETERQLDILRDLI